MTGRQCLVASCNDCRFCLTQEDTPDMSKPTHTVSTDALATLGTIIDKTAGRDAIHLAVEPVEAGEKLYPGQHISLSDGIATTGGKPVGIVDPYLPGPVFPGQMFWLVVYPRQITSLRHVWEHPAFPPSGGRLEASENEERPGDTKEAERWLRNYATSIGRDFDVLMSASDDYVKSGVYFKGNADEYGTYDELQGKSTHPDFWKHYQIYRGVTVSSDSQDNFFTCAC